MENSSRATGGPNKVVIGIIVALVVAGALYAFGLMSGKGQMAAQKTDYEAQLQTSKASLQSANEQVATLTERGYLMQGQLFLYRTAVDLDQRNFGIANTHLKSAAASLAQVKNTQAEKVSALHDEIAATNINVATNLQTQRDKVLGFVKQLDALAPPSEISSAPATQTATPENSETTPQTTTPETTTPDATSAPGEVPPAQVH